MTPFESTKEKIIQKLGFFPAFFESSQGDAKVLDYLWNHSVTSYFENPLPLLFKEKLSALLALYSPLPYYIVCHTSPLSLLGNNADQIIKLLESTPIDVVGFNRSCHIPKGFKIKKWPLTGSDEEEQILTAAVAIFLEIGGADLSRELRKALEPKWFSDLMILIHYNQFCFTWVKAHQEIFNNSDPYVKSSYEFLSKRNKTKDPLAALIQERLIREKFVYTLTHDLRNPLGTIRLNGEILVHKFSENDMVTKAGGRIVKAVLRMDDLIRDLLNANLIQSGKELPLSLEPSDLEAVATTSIEIFRERFGDRFSFVSDGPVFGNWSADGIRRSIENLLSNAVKYGLESAPITLRVQKNANDVEISVHNQGAPIPIEDQAQVFQAFHRLQNARDSSGTGWGLGLAFVRAVAKRHGGDVDLVSTEDAGTTFRMKLPL